MSQPYNQPGSQQPYGNPDVGRGAQLAQTSMILGILSLFIVGIVLGPIAIVKAKQAEQLGGDAKVGKITGWIGAILGVLALIGIILYFVLIASLIGAGTI